VLAAPVDSAGIVDVPLVRRRSGVPRNANLLFLRCRAGLPQVPQTSDDEVIALLDRARDGFRYAVASRSAGDPPLRDKEVRMTAGDISYSSVAAILSGLAHWITAGEQNSHTALEGKHRAHRREPRGWSSRRAS
jgi:hypothetical protein